MDPTLIGVLVTASVSLIGVLATWQANCRMRQEHQDEQARLKLDAAMRAGALFSSEEQRPADPASIASGLLALTRLDHADLAVALLVDLWSGGEERGVNGDERVANETAVLVIDAALRSKTTPNAQLVAAELLCRNARRLNACQSLHWPSVIDGGVGFGVWPEDEALVARCAHPDDSCPRGERCRAAVHHGSPLWRVGG